MTNVSFTEFRKNASKIISRIEKGETVFLNRHGRPVVRLTPVEGEQPSWKKPGLRLAIKGAGLSSAIIEERRHETLS